MVFRSPHTSHLTPHTSHLTPHTSHLTPHTSRLTPHTSRLTPHTSPLTPCSPRSAWTSAPRSSEPYGACAAPPLSIKLPVSRCVCCAAQAVRRIATAAAAPAATAQSVLVPQPGWRALTGEGRESAAAVAGKAARGLGLRLRRNCQIYNARLNCGLQCAFELRVSVRV